MENATKALIIAGAILVAILLVTMGITLLSNTGGLTEGSKNQMSELEVRQFNGRLSEGIGENVSGSNVISMLETIEHMKRETPDLKLDVNKGADIDEIKAQIKKTRRYTVNIVHKDDKSGLIDEIEIII